MTTQETNNAITTATISESVATQFNLTKKQSREIVDSIVQQITDAVVAGERVQLFQFGQFSTVDTIARTGRNPKTGEALDIPASKKVSFKASSALKNAVKATV